MKAVSFINTLGILVVMLGCSGGSSNPPEPPIVVIPPAFSLKVQQRNECGQVSPLSNASILIYDESPNQNPESDFTVYTTGSDGFLELDLPQDGKVSFTVSTLDSSDNYRNYSFIDLNVDDYDLTALYGRSAFTNDACSCQTVGIDATVETGHFETELRASFLEWGDYLKQASGMISGQTVELVNVETCNQDYENLPIIVLVETYNDEVLYGSKANPTPENLLTPVSIDKVAQKQNKPNFGFDYELRHRLLIDNNLYDLPGEDRYNKSLYNAFSFTNINPDYHLFFVDRPIDTTYNGNENLDNIFVLGQSIGITAQVSDDPSSITNISTTTGINIDFDDTTRSFTIALNSSDTHDMYYVSRRYTTPDESSVYWHFHSPTTSNFYLPKLDSALENIIDSSLLSFQLISAIDIENETNFSEAVKRNRFNGSNGKINRAYSSKHERLLYFDSGLSINNKSKQVHLNLDDELR